MFHSSSVRWLDLAQADSCFVQQCCRRLVDTAVACCYGVALECCHPNNDAAPARTAHERASCRHSPTLQAAFNPLSSSTLPALSFRQPQIYPSRTPPIWRGNLHRLSSRTLIFHVHIHFHPSRLPLFGLLGGEPTARSGILLTSHKRNFHSRGAHRIHAWEIAREIQASVATDSQTCALTAQSTGSTIRAHYIVRR